MCHLATRHRWCTHPGQPKRSSHSGIEYSRVRHFQTAQASRSRHTPQQGSWCILSYQCWVHAARLGKHCRIHCLIQLRRSPQGSSCSHHQIHPNASQQDRRCTVGTTKELLLKHTHRPFSSSRTWPATPRVPSPQVCILMGMPCRTMSPNEKL